MITKKKGFTMSDGCKFALCVAFVCLIYPPMLGYVFGMGMFFVGAYIIYSIIGGDAGFFG